VVSLILSHDEILLLNFTGWSTLNVQSKMYANLSVTVLRSKDLEF
jgi:hypothetical protein